MIEKKQKPTYEMHKAEENEQKAQQTKKPQIFPLIPTSPFFLQLTALLVSITRVD